MRTELGKIQRATFGFGGYQDAQFGVWFTLGGSAWGVGDGRGFWSSKPTKSSEWTKDDQIKFFGENTAWLLDIMKKAKVSSVDQLVGIPVEVTFDVNVLKSWRVLEEVL